MSKTLALADLTVEIDGRALPAAHGAALGEVSVQARLSQPTLCELVFYEPPSLRLAPGAVVRVMVGAFRTPLFVGEVTAIEDVYGPAAERRVYVRSYDRLHRLRKRQSLGAYVQVTVRELTADLAARIGLAVEAVEAGPISERVFHYHSSDLDLLNETASACGLYLTLRDETLHLITLEGLGEPLRLVLGESLLEARLERSGEATVQNVIAEGWTALEGEAFEERTTQPRRGRRSSASVSPDAIGGSPERTLLNEAVQDTHHLEFMAQAELDRRAAHEVTLWGIAEGDPNLMPGARVAIEGIDEELAGTYVLTSVRHTLDAQSGFISEIDTSPPAPPSRSRCAVATLGSVIRVDDPAGLGRVQVSLPTYDQMETEWMQVLSIGAGDGKGLTILPDVGDAVLVLLSHEQPGQGIVLGGLYGMAGPADSGVEGTSVKRYTLLTPGGQRVQLDDGANICRIENAGGSYVTLAPDRVTVHAETDLVIEAPGRHITLRGQAIDMESG
jgi:phage baseplate assembly protein gpV/phage protein D